MTLKLQEAVNQTIMERTSLQVSQCPVLGRADKASDMLVSGHSDGRSHPAACRMTHSRGRTRTEVMTFLPFGVPLSGFLHPGTSTWKRSRVFHTEADHAGFDIGLHALLCGIGVQLCHHLPLSVRELLENSSTALAPGIPAGVSSSSISGFAVCSLPGSVLLGLGPAHRLT